MRKLRTAILSILLVGLMSSCQDSPIESNELEFESVAIPSAYKDSQQGRNDSESTDEVTFEVSVTSPDGIESTGYGRMILTGDESIASFELTSNIFQETGMGSNFWVDAIADSYDGGRIEERVCNCSGYAKGNGRGKCRVKCVGYVLLAVGVAVLSAASNLK